MNLKLWSFLLIVLWFTFNCFAIVNPDSPSKTCTSYANEMAKDNTAGNPPGPDSWVEWWDDVEYGAMNSFYGSDWQAFFGTTEDIREDFFKERSGRSGSIVWYNYTNQVIENIQPGYFAYICSGTLIDERHFLTAGHCGANFADIDGLIPVGVLFGIQNHYEEDTSGVIQNHGLRTNPHYSGDHYFSVDFKYGGQYIVTSNHPAFFPIEDPATQPDFEETNVENNFAASALNARYLEWGVGAMNADEIKESGKVISKNGGWSSITKMLRDYENGFSGTDEEKRLYGNTVDYGIYRLGKNNNNSFPANTDDPWEWESEKNKLNTFFAPYCNDRLWLLCDNTNGHRGWSRIELNPPAQEAVSVYGHPIGVPRIVTYGRVHKIEDDPRDNSFGSSYGKAYYNKTSIEGVPNSERDEFTERLVLNNANFWGGISGSTVYTSDAKVTGIAVWNDCVPGGASFTSIRADHIFSPAKNLATPLSFVCNFSRTIKKAGKDYNCNGRSDWWDMIFFIRPIDFSRSIKWMLPLTNKKDVYAHSVEVKRSIYNHASHSYKIINTVLPPNTVQYFTDNSNVLHYIYLNENAQYEIVSDGITQGIIEDFPAVYGSEGAVHDGKIFLAGGKSVNNAGYEFLQNMSSNDIPYLIRLTNSGNSVFTPSIAAELPDGITNIKLLSLNNGLYVAGNVNGLFSIYRFIETSSSGGVFQLINNSLSERYNYSIYGNGNTLYVAGGFNAPIDTVLYLEKDEYPVSFNSFDRVKRIDLSSLYSQWEIVIENADPINIHNSVMVIDGNDLVMFDPAISDKRGNMQHVSVDLSSIPVSETHIGITHSYVPQESVYRVGKEILSIEGMDNILAAGTRNNISIFDITNPVAPELLYEKNVYGSVRDLVIYNNTVFAAVQNGIDIIELDTYTYTHKHTYGSTAALKIIDDLIYIGDGQGIKIMDPQTYSIIKTKYTTGDVTQLEVIEDTLYTFEWGGLKRYHKDSLSYISTYYYYPAYNPESDPALLHVDNGILYATDFDDVFSLSFNGAYVIEEQSNYRLFDMLDSYTYNGYIYYADDSELRIRVE